MQLTGKVIETKTRKGVSKAGKEWKSKQIIMEYQEGNYTKTIAFELFGDNNIDSNPVKKGQVVTVDFSVESREYNGNYYTSANAWRITPGGASETMPEHVEMTRPADPLSDLPF